MESEELRLKLVNFRCHRSLSLQIPAKGLTLLRGRSGAGKSSILAAIEFALYGKIKKPQCFGETGCSVTLQIQGVLIFRSRAPNRLVVTEADGTCYEDASAESRIVQLMGMTEEEFGICSFIRQKTEGSLLYLTPAKQLEFLEKLAFRGCTITASQLKERCSEIITKIKTDVARKEGECSYAEKKLLEMERDCGEPVILSGERSVEESLELYHSTKATVATLQEQQAQLSAKLIAAEEIDRLEKELETVTHKMHKKLSEMIKQLKEPLGEVPSLEFVEKRLIYLKRMRTEIQASEALRVALKNDENIRAEIAKKRANLPILPDQSEIDSLKQQLVEATENQRQCQKWDTLYTNLRALGIKSFKALKKRVTADEYCLKCPACDAALALKQGELCAAEGDVDINPEGAAERSQLLKKFEDAGLTSKPNKPADTQLIISSLERLKQAKSKYTAESAKIQALTEQLSEGKLPKGSGEPDISISPEAINTEIELLLQIASLLRDDRIDSLKQKIARLEKNAETTSTRKLKKSLQNVSEQISTQSEQLTELEQLQTQFEAHRLYIRQQADIEKQKKQLAELAAEHVKMHNILESYIILKEKIITAESLSFDATVSNINYYASQFLKKMFKEDDIHVTLEAFRQLKSSKEVKSRINAMIEYKGYRYDSLEQISGGEQDRISLAFVLAINLLFGSRILMLDECLASLDGALNTEILESLREYATNRTIIVVSHEANPGLFDTVIDV